MRRFWNEAERKILIELYPDHSAVFIGKKLNRSVTSIYSQAYLLNLKKSDEYMKIALQRKAENLKIVGKNYRYKKGQKPMNYGQKMSKELYEKCKVTFFATGHSPHNEKHDGYERIDNKDGYVHVRISKGKFKLKHRIIWEKEYGPIPKGYVIVFKNGNKYDFDINNLEMISMAENMERNRITKYPKEIYDAIKLKNKLKNLIHEKQN